MLPKECFVVDLVENNVIVVISNFLDSCFSSNKASLIKEKIVEALDQFLVLDQWKFSLLVGVNSKDEEKSVAEVRIEHLIIHGQRLSEHWVHFMLSKDGWEEGQNLEDFLKLSHIDTLVCFLSCSLVWILLLLLLLLRRWIFNWVLNHSFVKLLKDW